MQHNVFARADLTKFVSVRTDVRGPRSTASGIREPAQMTRSSPSAVCDARNRMTSHVATPPDTNGSVATSASISARSCPRATMTPPVRDPPAGHEEAAGRVVLVEPRHVLAHEGVDLRERPDVGEQHHEHAARYTPNSSRSESATAPPGRSRRLPSRKTSTCSSQNATRPATPAASPSGSS
jgi:hypothetical protein